MCATQASRKSANRVRGDVSGQRSLAELGGVESLTTGVIDHEGVVSPRSSLWSHGANRESCWAIRNASARFFAMQSMFFVFILLLSPPFPLFFLRKKWVLLWNAVIHTPWQCFCLWTTRGITYFTRGRESWHFWWTQSSSHVQKIFEKKHTTASDVKRKSSTWGLVSHYLRGSTSSLPFWHLEYSLAIVNMI